tara:strand:+ start:367 stop:774 length:408 start_codon:yes stop_codon:yes gene_type:complete
MSKKIQKKLDLVPFEEPKRSTVEDTKDDYEFARKNLHDLTSDLNKAIEDLADVARTSQHPRAYEVLDKLFRTKADTSKDLLELLKRKQDIIKTEEDITGGPKKQETHNHLHITTAELNKMLEGKKKDDGEDTSKE